MKEPPMGGVFINYRAKDNPMAAATIYQELAGRFGAEQVFRDADSIQAGDHYPTELRAGLERADVLLAVIGPQWNRLTDEHGTLLIQRDDDWVRWEIAKAVKRGIRIVPVLLRDVPDNAEILDRTALPDNIKELANYQTFEISQRRLTADLHLLADRLVQMVPSLAAHSAADRTTLPRVMATKITRRTRRLAIASAVVAVAVGAPFIVGAVLTNEPDRPHPSGLAGRTTIRPTVAPRSSVPPRTTVAATMHYTVSCDGVRIWGTWPYYAGANQLDVEIDGVIIGGAGINMADDYDSVIPPDAGLPCQWTDANNKTATVDLSVGTGQHQISVWSIFCQGRPGCSATKMDTFTR